MVVQVRLYYYDYLSVYLVCLPEGAGFFREKNLGHKVRGLQLQVEVCPNFLREREYWFWLIFWADVRAIIFPGQQPCKKPSKVAKSESNSLFTFGHDVFIHGAIASALIVQLSARARKVALPRAWWLRHSTPFDAKPIFWNDIAFNHLKGFICIESIRGERNTFLHNEILIE